MNQIPYREQQYHPIRWIGKMCGHISDDFYKNHPETARIILDYEKQNPDPVDFSKPYYANVEEDDIPFSTTEGLVTYMEDMFQPVLDFFKHGQNIFQVRPELCEMLLQTDVNNVKITDIKLPFDFFYLYFGHAGPKLWGDYRLDGVYLKSSLADEHVPSIELNFIGSKFPNTYPPTAGSEIVFEHEIHLTEILLAIEDRTIGDNFYWTFKEGAPEAWEEPILMDENYDLWEPYVNDVYSLLINAILFINSRPEDTEDTYSDNTPQSLVVKVERAKRDNDEKTAKRTESKITSQGFSKVKLVGRKVAESLKMSRDSHSKRSHWRRGHWRRQKHGENLSEEKLIWIQPTLVAAGNDEHPEIKHVYDVDNQNNQS